MLFSSELRDSVEEPDDGILCLARKGEILCLHPTTLVEQFPPISLHHHHDYWGTLPGAIVPILDPLAPQDLLAAVTESWFDEDAGATEWYPFCGGGVTVYSILDRTVRMRLDEEVTSDSASLMTEMVIHAVSIPPVPGLHPRPLLVWEDSGGINRERSKLYLSDPLSGKLLLQIPTAEVPEQVHALLHVSHMESSLFCSGCDRDSDSGYCLSLFDVEVGKRIRRISTRHLPMSMVASSIESRLLYAIQKKSSLLYLFDCRTLQDVSTVNLSPDEPASLLLDSDTHSLFVGTCEGSVTVWDVRRLQAGRKAEHSLECNQEVEEMVFVSPTHLVCVGSRDAFSLSLGSSDSTVIARTHLHLDYEEAFACLLKKEDGDSFENEEGSRIDFAVTTLLLQVPPQIARIQTPLANLCVFKWTLLGYLRGSRRKRRNELL